MPIRARNLRHPSFPQPPDPLIRAWRYMDFSRLLSLIIDGQLYFRRVDLLQDKFEGAVTPTSKPAVREAFKRVLQGKDPVYWTDARIEARVDFDFGPFQTARQSSYVNCWRLGNRESDAMWRIYCPGGAGIAITLTYQALRDSVDDDHCYIGRIAYRNFDKDVMEFGNAFNGVMSKRDEFDYEQEARILYHYKEMVGWADTPTTPGAYPVSLAGPEFVLVPWSIADHAEAIVVSPYTEKWQTDIIRETIKFLAPDLARRIQTSAMAIDPCL